MSHSWIARELNVTEGWVKSALAREKKISRPATDGAMIQKKCGTRARIGAAPFGFEILDCRLVENPRELRVVQKIIEQWNAGHGPAAIARELNRSKFKTRKGTAWDHSVISDIIRRTQEGDESYARFAEGLRTYQPRKSPKTTRAKYPNVREKQPKTQYNKGEVKHE